MADKHLTDNLKGNYFSSERKDMKFLIENKALNLIAKMDGVLFFVWALVTVVQLLIK